LPGSELYVRGRAEVGACVTGMGAPWQRETRIQALDKDADAVRFVHAGDLTADRAVTPPSIVAPQYRRRRAPRLPHGVSPPPAGGPASPARSGRPGRRCGHA